MWSFFIDTGGTFTDCIARTPDGAMRRVKVLSSSALRARVRSIDGPCQLTLDGDWGVPDGFFVGYSARIEGADETREVIDYVADRGLMTLAGDALPDISAEALVELKSPEEPPLLAARVITGKRLAEALPPLAMRLATTRATNALLEGRGASVAAFFATGFEDLLLIGNQTRPDIFALGIEKPEPLYRAVYGLDDRMDSTGQTVREAPSASIGKAADDALAQGCAVAVVALPHSYRDGRAEERIARELAGAGFAHVVTSASVAPHAHYLRRAETAVIEGYLRPIMQAYLDRVAAALDGSSSLLVMTSAGGLAPRNRFVAKDSLLSGPAGGVAGAASIARQAGLARCLAFDMGGTSTDVSRWEGRFDYRDSHHVGHARLFSPALTIETVAAGGGSVCGFRHGALFVGPESAGAQPGPACYAAGGPLTISDVNLLLGRLNPASFGIPVSIDGAEAALQTVVDHIENATGEPPDRVEVLEGFLNIANERMADAIRGVSVRQGYAPPDYGLVAFGGAGGMHACAVASLLGIKTIVFPADAGLLSAEGLRVAAVEEIQERPCATSLDAEGAESSLATALEEAAGAALTLLRDTHQGGSVAERTISLRFAGQDSTIDIDWPGSLNALSEAFLARYRDVFGYSPTDKAVEAVSVRVIARVEETATAGETFPSADSATSKADVVPGDGGETAFPFVPRADLDAGAVLAGPLLVGDRFSTLVVEDGWRLLVGDAGSLKLVAADRVEKQVRADATAPEVVQRELFTHRFTQIVEEMGHQLIRTAFSTNVKERLDLSCGLFDGQGRLIVNAPHIPVHLGALGQCVRAVAARLDLQPGDSVVTNHPGIGGSHLPDVTVISPLFAADGERIVGYVANRAHHAEIGGKRPGSMPPDARSLAEEGVIIEPQFLARANGDRFEAITGLLGNHTWPSRAVRDNMADLRAQLSANTRGLNLLRGLVEAHGADTVQHYMDALRATAADAMREALASHTLHEAAACQHLDDGSPIAVTLSPRSGGGLRVDFSGSAGVHAGNLNATPAIVASAVIYVLRLLAGGSIPLNEGFLNAVDIVTPEGILNPPFVADPGDCPAVVGGNVETSQRIVSVLLEALGIAAGSQPTMNNLVFGNGQVSYYETVCGGEGASPGHPGRSGVHTHMTNTAITDLEVLENRYPVRLERFAVRRGSGGHGAEPGGCGIVREITFLKGVTLSLLTQGRERGGFGAHGGGEGDAGRQWLVRGGKREDLPAICTRDLAAGDQLTIETPGGGGWGTQPS